MIEIIICKNVEKSEVLYIIGGNMNYLYIVEDIMEIYYNIEIISIIRYLGRYFIFGNIFKSNERSI